MSFTFGSLFTGIGGLDLGLERAGMSCQWQVEINEYARKILEKHWPHVPKFRDVRECRGNNLTPVDLICGGFPCQDVSQAGYRIGIEGSRSGLWAEYFRIICELQPRYVLVENVSDLRCRGLSRVLGELAQVGYDAEWYSLQARQLGAFHRRERLFIIAYRSGVNAGRGKMDSPQPLQLQFGGIRNPISSTHWAAGQPSMVRVAHGIPRRMDRTRGLGNAVVPQIAEHIGRVILNKTSIGLTNSLDKTQPL